MPFIFKYKDSEISAFHFSAVIPGYGDTDVIAENQKSDKWSLLKFMRCQIVYGKIKNADENIQISIKLNDVWDREIQVSKKISAYIRKFQVYEAKSESPDFFGSQTILIDIPEVR